MQKRIEYIDALRGFTMILVVFAHVETFMLSIDPGETFISSLFLSFRMPLFFFISGLVAYKESVVWNTKQYVKSVRERLRVSLLPTLFWGLLYIYTFSLGDICTFFNHYYKFGYWFTLCLLGLLLILYTYNYFVHKITRIQNKKVTVYSLLLITLIAYLFRYVYKVTPNISHFSDILCLHQICVYMPFFVFGYIMSQYKVEFHRILDNKIIQSCILGLFCIFFLFQKYVPNDFYEINKMLLIYRSVQYIIVGILGICVVYNFFRLNSQLFSRDKKIGELLQRIGKRTLDIYMLHYFFLTEIPFLEQYVNRSSNIVIEISVVFLISIIIVSFTLILGKLIRTNSILGYILLGSKNK